MFMHSTIPLTIGALTTLASAQQAEPAMLYTRPAAEPYFAGFVNDAAGGLVAVGASGTRYYNPEFTGATHGDYVAIFGPDSPEPIRVLSAPNDQTTGDDDYLFGVDISMNEELILVGASEAPAIIQGNTITEAGTAYLYDIATGNLLMQFSSPSPSQDANFGDRVVLSDGYALISDKTAVYRFNASTGEFLSVLEHINVLTSSSRPADEPAWIAASEGFAAVAYDNPNNPADTLPSGIIGIYDLSTGDRIKTIDPSTLVKDAQFTFGLAMRGSQVAFGIYREASLDGAPIQDLLEVVLYDYQNDQLAHLLARPEEFTPESSFSDKSFGFAIDMDDQSILITEPTLQRPPTRRRPNAYLYSRESGTLQGVISDPTPELDTGPVGHGFGRDASIDGENLYIGGQFGFYGGGSSGTVAFDKETTSPIQLFSSEPYDVYTLFGDTIYASGDNLVAANPWAGVSFGNRGRTTVLSVETGLQTRSLNPPIFSASYYGSHIDGEGDLVLIGAGSVLGGTNGPLDGFAHLISLTDPDLSVVYGEDEDNAGSELGAQVAIVGSYAALGNWSDSNAANRSGSISVYDLMTGQFQQRITAQPPLANEQLGRTLAGNTTTIFASGRNPASEFFITSSWVKAIDPQSGNTLAVLTPIGPDGTDQTLESNFGNALAANDQYLLVGAPRNSEGGQLSGSAYLYDAQSFELIRKFSNPSPSEFQQFGTDVALGDDFYAVTSRDQITPNTSQGEISVYDRNTHALITSITYTPAVMWVESALTIDGRSLFVSRRGLIDQPDLPPDIYLEPEILRHDIPQPCQGDTNGDRTVDLADLNIVLAAFGQSTLGGPDLNGSGTVDIDDLNTILNAFGTACD